ncbi:replicase polyprotein 1ab [Striga asiatica]|uniref:Replicase polyprotein 1ab n=1 Tax=Striga asiatica TaxID=4170 RepID=A0A5A7Q009_STRAF|nr:replicase polyprotein 1ab [Striga asiatica]
MEFSSECQSKGASMTSYRIFNRRAGREMLLIERSQGAKGKCFREQPSTIRHKDKERKLPLKWWIGRGKPLNPYLRGRIVECLFAELEPEQLSMFPDAMVTDAQREHLESVVSVDAAVAPCYDLGANWTYQQCPVWVLDTGSLQSGWIRGGAAGTDFVME